MHSLTAIDVTNASNSMGSAYEKDMWVKYFNDKKSAQEYAQKYHDKKGNGDRLKWNSRGSSQDMGWIIYSIKKVDIEK